MSKRSTVTALLALTAATAVQAAGPLAPTGYDMFNGHGQASGGSFNYWDLAYNGTGSTSTDNAILAGGQGDLTDGVTTTQNWFSVENSAGTGPYVGWYQAVLPGSVLVTFNFASMVNVDTLSIHADDSGGAGGVALPSAVALTWAGGGNASLPVVDPDAGGGPSWLVFSGLSISNTSWVSVALSYNNAWVFVDEVAFNGAPVPEPASWMLMLGGVAGLWGTALRRRSRGLRLR
jgi:hypothetical protein